MTNATVCDPGRVASDAWHNTKYRDQPLSTEALRSLHESDAAAWSAAAHAVAAAVRAESAAPAGEGERPACKASEVEIIGTDGKVHYRRPVTDPMVFEAIGTPGYSVRGVHAYMSEPAPPAPAADVDLSAHAIVEALCKRSDGIYRGNFRSIIEPLFAAHAAALTALTATHAAERERLARFKQRTHELLDAMGVPTCEGSECRIGARLDWLKAERERLEGEIERLKNSNAKLRERALNAEHDAFSGESNLIDQLRVQLAGVLTAADGHTNDPAKQGDWGWSPAYQATLELRLHCDAAIARATAAEAALAAERAACERLRGRIETAAAHLDTILTQLQVPPNLRGDSAVLEHVRLLVLAQATAASEILREPQE